MTSSFGEKRSAEFSLDSDHPNSGRERVDSTRDAGNESSASERHDHHCEVIYVLYQLETECALARDDGRIVEGMDEVKTGLSGTFLGQHDAVVERFALEMHRGPVADRRLGLRYRGLGWHVDLAPHARGPCRERGGLGVVAGRGHDDSGRGVGTESGELG